MNIETESRDARISSLEEEVNDLKAAMDDAEQYARRNCLILSGVEEREGECTDELVTNICKKELDIELTVEDIDRSHRLGTPPSSGESSDGHPTRSSQHRRRLRNIIMKFTNYRIREKIYSSRKELRKSSSGTPLYINESLTKERSSLFWKIKKAINGVIVVKPPNGRRIKVTRESDLVKLTNLNFS